MKYPIGTVVIALVGAVGTDAQHRPCAIPPGAAGSVIENIGEDHAVLFGENLVILAEELSDRRNFVTVTVSQVAAMFERLQMANHQQHMTLLELEDEFYAVATGRLRTERQTMREFLKAYIPE